MAVKAVKAEKTFNPSVASLNKPERRTPEAVCFNAIILNFYKQVIGDKTFVRIGCPNVEETWVKLFLPSGVKKVDASEVEKMTEPVKVEFDDYTVFTENNKVVSELRSKKTGQFSSPQQLFGKINGFVPQGDNLHPEKIIKINPEALPSGIICEMDQLLNKNVYTKIKLESTVQNF